MSDRVCGICFRTYSNLPQHLRKTHQVRNRKEFQLLLQYGNARTANKADCPICNKSSLVRLDRHLAELHGLQKHERETLVKEAKRVTIRRQIMELRRSEPKEPLLSSLGDDWGPIDDDEMMDIGEASFHDEDSGGTAQTTSTPLIGDYSPQEEPLAVTSHSGTLAPPPSPCSTETTDSPLHASCCGSQTNESQQSHSVRCSLDNSPVSQPCIGCKILAFKVKTLEAEVAKLAAKVMPTAPQMETSSPSKTPFFFTKDSLQKGKHAPRRRMPENLTGRILLDFEKFILGSKTGRKDKENAHHTCSVAQRFCQYMMVGSVVSGTTEDLLYLNQIQKIQKWPVYLKHKGYVATSIMNMLGTAFRFLIHINTRFLGVSGLKEKHFANMLYELRQTQKELKEEVIVHQQKLKSCKTEKQVSPSDENCFLVAAKKRMPELLESLKNNGQSETDHETVMGYLMGYLGILTGHSSPVITSMTRENVLKPARSQQGFHITVDGHTTGHTHRQASLFLTRNEYFWLYQLIEILCVRERYSRGSYVFVTYKGKQIEKPTQVLKMAWRDAGLEGNVTFRDLRNSLATQASRYLTLEENNRVAKSMWHESDAAESLSDTEDGFNARQLRMKAMNMAVADVEENDPTEEETDDEDLLVLSETEHRSTLPSKKSETGREVIKEVHSNITVQFKTESSDSDENVPLSELREKIKRKPDFTVKSPSKCFVSLTALPDTTVDLYVKSLNLVRVSPLRQKKTSHTKICDGVQVDVPLVEVGQSQDSEIPPEDSPLKEAPAEQLPSHCVVQNTEQDKPTCVYQQLLPLDDPDEIQVVAETQMSQ